MIGVWQLVLIFAIILVLFGAGRIPKIMKDLGTGIRSFKEGFDGDDDNNKKDCNNNLLNTNPHKTSPKTSKSKK